MRESHERRQKKNGEISHGQGQKDWKKKQFNVKGVDESKLQIKRRKRVGGGRLYNKEQKNNLKLDSVETLTQRKRSHKATKKEKS